MKPKKKTKRILSWLGSECIIVSRETITTSEGHAKKCCTIRVSNQLRFVSESELKMIEIEI
jgi:hypothetical protein